MQIWYLTVELKIWNIIYMLGNRISQESLNFITKLYIDCTELQVEKIFVAYLL